MEWSWLQDTSGIHFEMGLTDLFKNIYGCEEAIASRSILFVTVQSYQSFTQSIVVWNCTAM